MPMSTRELYLVLRARDEASRTLRGISRELMSTGAAAASSAARANAAIARETAQRSRREAQMVRETAARQRGAAAMLRERAALARMNGATTSQIQNMQKQAIGFDQAARASENLAKQHDKAARAAQAHVQELQAAGAAAEDTAKQHQHLVNIMQQGGMGLATFGVGMVAVGAAAAVGIKSLVDVATEYQRQVRLTATQITGFKGNLQELGDIGRRTARDFAVPFESIQPALYDIFSSTDANVQQAELMLRAFAKAAVAGQVDIQDASRSTIGVLNAFSLPMSDVNKVLDMQFQLVREGVGTYQEWSDKIGLVSPSAARAGQSVQVMMAALATATRMGMSAARASTSVARAMDAMSNPVAIAKMKELGINAQDASGHMRPLNETLRDMRTAIMKLPEKDRVGAILDIFRGAGGTIEARRFLQTMLLVPGTLEQFDSILGQLSNSAGTMDQAYGLMADTAASKTQLLSNQWMLLKEGMGNALTPAFTAVVGWLTQVLDKFNQLSPEIKNHIALAAVFVTGLSLVGGVILVILGGLAVLIAAFAAAGSVLWTIVGAVTAVIVGLGLFVGAITAAYKNSQTFRIILSNMWDDVKAVGTIIGDVGRKAKSDFEAYILPPLQRIGAYINENVLPAFQYFRDEVASRAIPALRSIADVLQNALGVAMGFIGTLMDTVIRPAIENMTRMWIEHRDQLQPVIDGMITLGKYAGMLAAILVALALGTIGGIVIAMFLGLIQTVSLVIGIAVHLIHIWEAVKDGFGMLVDNIKSQIGAWKKYWGDLEAYVKNLPDTVKNAVSGFGSVLYNAGKDLINGLINGIKAQLSDLASTLSGVSSFIQQHKGPPAYDKRMLVPAGKSIMGGLMRGIKESLPALASQILGVNNTLQFAGNTDGPAFGGRGFMPPASGSAAAQAPVTKNVTVNVTMQSPAPSSKTQAAELGWEVAKVM